MAKAKRVEKVKAKSKVRLTLTVEEAETLLGVTARIGGSSEDSPRKHTAAIYRALVDTGLNDPDHKTSPANRAIYFYNYDGINHTRWGF